MGIRKGLGFSLRGNVDIMNRFDFGADTKYGKYNRSEAYVDGEKILYGGNIDFIVGVGYDKIQIGKNLLINKLSVGALGFSYEVNWGEGFTTTKELSWGINGQFYAGGGGSAGFSIGIGE